MFSFFALNSIRSRMVSGFLFLTLLILILAVVSLTIIDSITRVARADNGINRLEIYTLSLMKSDNDFFDLETINEEYFKTNKSDFIKKRDSLNVLINTSIKSLIRSEVDEKYGIENRLRKIDTTLSNYNLRFTKLENLIFKKGFKDYGVEGAMRKHAHTLEQIIDNGHMLDVLFLRRHEKDFLLRNDTSYISAFKSRSQHLLEQLEHQKGKNGNAIAQLTQYSNLFYELVEIQIELGLSSKHGLRNELNELTYSLSNQYYSLSENSSTYSETVYQRVRIFYIALLIGAILFSLISGYWISKRLSEPIANLSRTIQDAIASKNAIKTDLSMKKAAVEITDLSQSFNLLIDQVKTQMKKVKKNSKLLMAKNAELEKTNRELDNFLYSTAHDLRSPLSSLLGLLNLIKHDNKQDNLTPYFILMEKSIHRSENFISQIVSFSQNKRMEIHPESLDIAVIISEILESHQFVDGSSQIEKICEVEDIIPFYSDRNRIIMIFTNLISNAIKYADLKKTRPFIKIAVTVNPETVEIEFSDNGLGIHEEHLGNIFNMFYRAHTESKGSGLGLFIFKETINRLGGQASVESVLGKGTKFFLRIPNLNEHVLTQQNLGLEL